MKFAKHIHVLHLLSTVPAPGWKYNWREAYPYEQKVGPHYVMQRIQVMTTEEANAAWDHLFTYIFADWGEPQSAMGQDLKYTYVTAAGRTETLDCQAMLRMPADEVQAKLESLPPYFTESVFPVAVGRYLLRELSIPMNHRQTTTFSEFHRRYGRMILEY